MRDFQPRGTIHLDVDETLFHRPGRKVNGASKWTADLTDYIRFLSERLSYPAVQLSQDTRENIHGMIFNCAL